MSRTRLLEIGLVFGLSFAIWLTERLTPHFVTVKSKP